MKNYFKIARKNIMRNRKRTFITILTIFIGVVASLMAKGMIIAVQKAIKETVTEVSTGHFQIHAKSYMESIDLNPIHLSIEEESVIEEIVAKSPHELNFSRRINFGGMIYPNDKKSGIFQGIALDPDIDVIVCPKLPKAIVEGRFLSNSDIHEAVVNKSFAKSMDIAIGQEVTLLSNDKNEFMNLISVKVVGFIESSLPGMSEKLVYVNLKVAQELLDLKNEYTELLIASNDLENSKIAMNKVKQQIIKKDLDYDVHFWDEVAVLFKHVIKFQEILSNIVSVIFLIMVTVAIINTMTMVVFERRSEIGMLRAMGMKRKQVVKLFLSESFLLGIIGALIGFVFASILVTVLNFINISFHPPGSGIIVTLKPQITWHFALFAMIFAIFTGIIASYYPTKMAAKLKPVDALKES